MPQVQKDDMDSRKAAPVQQVQSVPLDGADVPPAVGDTTEGAGGAIPAGRDPEAGDDRGVVPVEGEYRGLPPRPAVRSQCHETRRQIGDGRLVPCPYVFCRYNLHVDAARNSNARDPKASRLRIVREWDPDGDYPSCVLDVADQGPASGAYVGRIYGITRQSIDHRVQQAMAKIRGAGVRILRSQQYGDSE